MVNRKAKEIKQSVNISKKTDKIMLSEHIDFQKRSMNILYTLMLFPLVLIFMISGLLLQHLFSAKGPDISVVMPIYNSSEFLSDSIDSVLYQTFENFELILVNDGSTDNSLEIMQRFANKDKRIKLINLEKNSGAGAARNEGLKHVTGKYTIFVDSDDYMTPKMLEIMYTQAEKQNLDMVMCLVYARDNSSDDELYPSEMVDRKISFQFRYLMANNIEIFSYKNMPKIFFQIARKYVWDKMIRTSVIKDNRLYFDNVPSHNDTYFITMAMVHAKRIGYVTKRLYVYRANRKGSVSQKNPDDLKSVYFTFIKIKQSLENMGIYKELSESFMRWVGVFIPPEDWPLPFEEDRIYRQKLIEFRYGGSLTDIQNQQSDDK